MKEVKEGEIRKQEILVAARQLFVTKGYDQTSVNDILKVVDIAKGTFYYYFASKEEVLTTIIVDIVNEGARKAATILQDKRVPLVERMVMAIMAQTPDFEGVDVIKEEMHKIENAKLERVYLKTMLAKITEVMQVALDEGVEDKIITTPYPRESLESILLMGHIMFDCDVFDWKTEEYPKKIEAFLFNIEKLLGLKEGTTNSMLQMFEQLR